MVLSALECVSCGDPPGKSLKMHVCKNFACMQLLHIVLHRCYDRREWYFVCSFFVFVKEIMHDCMYECMTLRLFECCQVLLCSLSAWVLSALESITSPCPISPLESITYKPLHALQATENKTLRPCKIHASTRCAAAKLLILLDQA